MAVLLVRHAKAGNRERWEAPDDLRPLTPRGEAQAEGLVATLAAFDVTRILSSPYLRCTQTVAPLAAARGLAVEPNDDLAEGAGRAGLAFVRRLLDGRGDTVPRTQGDTVLRTQGDTVLRTQGDTVLRTQGDTVLCTHGDVVEEVLDGLGVARAEGTRKGATWVLEPGNARQLPPA